MTNRTDLWEELKVKTKVGIPKKLDVHVIYKIMAIGPYEEGKCRSVVVNFISEKSKMKFWSSRDN